jgi:hypothetical protein
MEVKVTTHQISLIYVIKVPNKTSKCERLVILACRV